MQVRYFRNSRTEVAFGCRLIAYSEISRSDYLWLNKLHNSLCYFFSALCALGINSVIIKELLDNPTEQGVAIGTTIILRTISSVLSVIMIIGIVSILDAGEKIKHVVIFMAAIKFSIEISQLLFQRGLAAWTI